MERIIGIGEYVIYNDKNDTLRAFALASCIVLTAYSPSKSIAGMVHIALPTPRVSNGNSRTRPCYYATTGVSLFIGKMCSEFGCLKGELVINLARC